MFGVINDHTTAIAQYGYQIVFPLYICIYHQFRYNVSVVTTVDIPVEDVNPADWSRENPVMAVVGTSNVSDHCIKYQRVVQTK